MSLAGEVIADDTGKFAGNALRFGTRAEATLYVGDLANRWLAERETQVVQSAEPVNHRIVDGVLSHIE